MVFHRGPDVIQPDVILMPWWQSEIFSLWADRITTITFRVLDYISGELGCIGIEMETAAVFKAARMVGIRAAALFSVSDVPVIKKSLFAGRSLEEQNNRKEIRARVLTRALLDCLGSYIEDSSWSHWE